jgi:hypothetical protein
MWNVPPSTRAMFPGMGCSGGTAAIVPLIFEDKRRSAYKPVMRRKTLYANLFDGYRRYCTILNE